MKLVIDTSILIDYLRGGLAWQDFLEGLPRNAELFLPTIAIFELFSGKSTKTRHKEKDILDLLKYFSTIDLNSHIAKRAGELRRDIGIHISPQDYVIAASAIEINGRIVTLDRKDFEQITQVSLYQL